jgi:PhzF family phenazine biosynthesis protein
MSQHTLSYVTVDVFTKTRYIGNPLAIVHVPASTSISQEQKQLIAREFNFSETVFLHLPADDNDTSTDNFRKIDIFTPDTELPFAGHPTIGTACHVLSALSSASSSSSSSDAISGRFQTKAGAIALSYDTRSAVARAGIPHDVRIHATRCSLDSVLAAQPALKGSSGSFAGAEAAVRDAGFPVVSIVRGMTFVLVELDGLEALAKLAPVAEMPETVLDEGWARVPGARTEAWIYGFARVGEGEGGVRKVRTRLMMLGGEDPATGSAACALSSYLTLTDAKPGDTVRYEITQGVEMGRQSDIGVEVKLGADGKVETVHLSGSTVQIMEGKLVY